MSPPNIIGIGLGRRRDEPVKLGNANLLGVISERDYMRKVVLKERSSKETPVRDIMTAQLITVNPGDSVTECMRIMTEKRVRHLPVLEGTRLVGILSIGDLINWDYFGTESGH